MTTAENIAIISADRGQFAAMHQRAQNESIREEHDEWEGVGMHDYTFADGSTVRVCSGQMEAI